VHKSEIRLSVEGTLQEVKEPKKKNAIRLRGILLGGILQIRFIEIPETQGVLEKSKYS
jgi:hypothetical protein